MITKIEYRIRKADIKDVQNVFELSNDKLVRQNSINTKEIQWKNHVDWFQRKINDKYTTFFIIETLNGEFLGQLRIETSDGENVISVSIKKEFRGKKLAAGIIKNCLQKSNIKNFTAYIKENNIASLKAFEKAGFTYKENCSLNNISLKKYIFY